MNATRRRVSSVLGVLVMLIGALMVIAPLAGATAPGNNGTVKIDGRDLNDGPGHTGKPNDPDETDPDNDPHVTCDFELEFFGYDPGQKADIVFTAHPPTGEGGLLLSQLGVVINPNDVVGGGSVPDLSIPYDVLAQFDLDQFTSVHEVHGWHVKLSLTLYNADGSAVPGGQKHKVFWLDECAPTPDTGSLSVDKVVSGNDPQPESTAFGFTVSCTSAGSPVDLNGEAAGTQAVFTLTAAQTPKVFPGLPVGATCTVTETNAQGADSTSITVDGGAPTAGTSVTGVVIGAGTTRAVVVTNVFNTEGAPGALSVDKVVSGNDQPAASTAFGFTVDCTVGAQPVDLNGSAAGSQAVFTLTAAQAPMVFSNLPGGATCTVTETNAQGADSTSITVDGVAAATGNVTIGSGTTRTVVFTNVFDVTPVTVPPTPVPASLTVEKDVTGDVPDEWEFTFRLRGGDTNELFTLDQGDDDEAFTVPAGTYVLTEFEVPNDRATLIDVECDDAGADIDDGVVTLVLAAGDDVTCTFTNDFAEVAPSVVTTTTTTTTTTVAPTTTTTTVAPAAVLGESVTRLPRTGTHTGELAALGVLLIGLGATMVLVGRRREAVDL